MNSGPNKNFVFYPQYILSVNQISDEETKFLLVRAIIDYGITGEYDKSNPAVNAVMVNIAECIDSSDIKSTMINYHKDEDCRPFVFSSTYRECIDSMPSQKDKNLLLRAIINYGVTRMYDKSNPTVSAIMVNISKNIDSSEWRYKKCQENGALGGRPRSVKYEDLYWAYKKKKRGTTMADIARVYGVSERTVRRAVAYQRSLITPYEY